MKKTLVFLLMFGLLSIPLFAGGEKEGALEMGKELEYVSMWNVGEPQADFFKQMAKIFEEETGVKLTITWAGRDVLTKIRSRLLMGDAPDLVDHDFSELSGAFLRSDDILVEPLNDFFYNSKGPEGQKRLIDVFDEDLIKLYETDGKIYYYPYEYITSGFFYDRTLFRKYGLSAPTTWKQFMEVCETLKSKGISTLALDGNISFYNAYYYYWSVTRVLGPGSLKAAAMDKTGNTWNKPGYLKAAQMVYDLSAGGKNYFQSEYEGSNWPAAQADWALNKSTCILCGTWIPNETKKEKLMIY